MELILNILAWIIIGGGFVIGLGLIYMALRKKPPFAPGTEPKHYWDLTRAEKEEQLKVREGRWRDDSIIRDDRQIPLGANADRRRDDADA